MSIKARFALLYLPCLLLAALLPIHPRRSMTRAFVQGGGGDLISHDWKLIGWPELIDGLSYMRPEESVVSTVIGAATISAIVAAVVALELSSLWWLFSTRARTPSTPR